MSGQTRVLAELASVWCYRRKRLGDNSFACAVVPALAWFGRALRPGSIDRHD